MKRLLIIGAGGHGKVAAEAAVLSGWQEVVFADARWPSLTRNGEWPVALGDSDVESALPSWDGVFVAIGDNNRRECWLKSLLDASMPLVNIIHPTAAVSSRVHFGKGVLVGANAVVNIDCQIGHGAIINTGALVDHDCCLGSSVHVSPGACLAGSVCLGDRVWVGMGSRLLPAVHVGRDSCIGAGSTVLSDIPEGVTAFGCPARIQNR